MKIKRFIAAITMVCTLMSTNVFAGDFQEAAQEMKKKSEHLIVTDSHVYTDYTKAWGIKKSRLPQRLQKWTRLVYMTIIT